MLTRLLRAQAEGAFLAGRAEAGPWASQGAQLALKARPSEEAVPGCQLRPISALHAALFGVEMLLPCVFFFYYYYILIFHYKIKYLLKKGLQTEEFPLNRDAKNCVPACQVASVMCDSLQPRGHIARQAPLPLGFSRQEYWSGLPCPPPGDLPDPGIQPVSLISPASAGRLFTSSATWEAKNCKSSNYYQQTKQGSGNSYIW